ncbi:MAG: putative dsRNA-binding protein, partial [Coriobacteriia bacterium]|nr:putative dsRNA-binding protein [Coriobacteriia bacterium]
KLKIAVVSGPVLTSAAEDLGLESLLRLGESERSDGGRGRPSALENALEALVGAVYLDAGIETVRAFILRVLGDLIHPAAADEFEHPKSRLQELLQARGQTPEYEIVAFQGPPHRRMFSARALLGDEVLGEGTGPSKRAAEMEAARQALERLSENM